MLIKSRFNQPLFRPSTFFFLCMNFKRVFLAKLWSAICRHTLCCISLGPITSTYSKVPNNSAARLLIFSNFSLPTRLIWTYTLIKIQIIFLPTRLLSTIFYFFIYFQCFFQPFFITIASIMHYFHVFSSF